MKLGRRKLLHASLGLSQVALLSRLGAPSIASAQGMGGPTRLLTIFLPGGWMSPFALVPWSASEVATVLPAPLVSLGEPIYFSDAQVRNLDGSSDPGKLRVPALWDEAELMAGRPDRRSGTSPHGWSWKHHRLHENAMVVHGVDQGTVAHVGGQMSALCGVASSELKAPTVNALVAHHLFNRFPDRPIPSVWIGGPTPGALDLRSEATPAHITSQADVDFLLSDRPAAPWAGLRARDVNSTVNAVKFDGTSAGTGFTLNPLEAHTLKRMRELRGSLNPSSEAVVQQLHDSLVGVSKLLARDVATTVQNTPGLQLGAPFWAPAGGPFGLNLGSAFQDSGGAWAAQFNLALKLLKSDVVSSVAVSALGAGNWSFDNGHSEGHIKSFIQARGIFEILGRLLGEMKSTPRPGGKTLLDETLVVVLSDFSRTLPKASFSSDHWASNTVIFAGGGITPNRALGGYVVPNRPAADVSGHDGAPVGIRDELQTVTRVPRSADVVTTALAILGITGHRIPGGNGEILGVRAGT